MAPSSVTSKQRSLKRAVYCSGVGVHTGAPCQIRLEPAPVHSGRFFLSPQGDKLAAQVQHLCGSAYQTVLGSDTFQVQTPEHLLAAAFLLDIDNLAIHIDGPEVPILDGSALPWVQLMRSAGIVEQSATAAYAPIKRQELREGQSSILIVPSSALSLTVSIDFNHPDIGAQSAHFKPESLLHQLAPAQTFGFKADLPKLQAMGLARGANLKNTLVYDYERLINPHKKRFSQEALHHKALDILGDLSLLNQRIHAHITAHRPSHALNQAWLKRQELIQET